MIILIIEAIFVGFITYVIGTIVFNYSINKNNNYTNQPDGIGIAFFTSGFILHIFLDFIGFNRK
jgi:hypothetical protein